MQGQVGKEVLPKGTPLSPNPILLGKGGLHTVLLSGELIQAGTGLGSLPGWAVPIHSWPRAQVQLCSWAAKPETGPEAHDKAEAGGLCPPPPAAQHPLSVLRSSPVYHRRGSLTLWSLIGCGQWEPWQAGRQRVRSACQPKWVCFANSMLGKIWDLETWDVL